MAIVELLAPVVSALTAQQSQQGGTPATQRRVVRRATPAALTGVAGRPTTASACDIQDPRETLAVGSAVSRATKASAQLAHFRMRDIVPAHSSIE
jgi:hypothetical protein